MPHSILAHRPRSVHIPPLEIHFQPLVSLRRGTVLGVEALARGKDPETGALITPDHLFGKTRSQEARLELDRRCRQAALEAFRPLHKADPNLLLSINVDASIIDASSVHSKVLEEQVAASGIPPENIIVEIVESKAGGTLALIEFVAEYKRLGFVLALDDFGAGHSNLDRIHLLKPDLVKLDRCLISRIHRHFHKQEVVKSFVRLAGRTGCLVLGEGVERLDEALTLLECGVDVFQGFYFGRPVPGFPDWAASEVSVAQVAEAHKTSSIRHYNSEKIRFSGYNALVDRISATLGATTAQGNAPTNTQLEERLRQCLDADARIECLYLLDSQGIQSTDTVRRPEWVRKSRRLLYEPARRGADHSCKEYFLPLRSGLTRFTTEPYISQASGRRCLTISSMFLDPDGTARILCIDLNEE